MTSLAFGMGVLPMALASGAGSGAQRAIGTGVLGGMIVGALLGLFFVPLFFVVVRRLFRRRKDRHPGKQGDLPLHGTSEAGHG
jgi:multidrug efflux pump